MELTLSLPAFSIVNTKLCDDEWTVQTNKSQVLYIRPVANLHYSIVPYRSVPPVAAHQVMCRVDSIYWSCPTTTFSICIPNPNRSGPLRPEPVRSAAPELATAYPLRDIAIYEQYVLQMTGSNFLPISKIKINLSFTNDRLLSKMKLTIQYIWLITILHILNPLRFGPHCPNPS